MQNSLEEVWALLHFLAPQLFESLSMFQQLFANPVTAISEGRKPQDSAIVKHLHTVRASKRTPFSQGLHVFFAGFAAVHTEKNESGS